MSNNFKSYELECAIKKGNKSEVIQFIESGIPEKFNWGFDTPLDTAIVYNQFGILELLLRNGVDPNITNEHRETALMRAASNKLPEIVELLLRHGADPNHIRDDKNRISVLYGVYPNKDYKGMTSLMFAMETLDSENQFEVYNIDFDDYDIVSNPDYVYDADNKLYSIVQLLINSGADPNIQNKNNKTPLMYAAKCSLLNIVKLLLNSGADPNKQYSDGSTSLLYAVESGNMEIVELLLKSGANPNIQNNTGCSPLMKALMLKHSKIAELLLKSGVEPDIKDNHGKTALMYAAENGCTDIVELLLKQGVSTVSEDKYGNTALIYAVRNKHLQVTELLLKSGAEPNIKNLNGNTALISAIRNNDTETIKLLLLWGATVSIEELQDTNDLYIPDTILEILERWNTIMCIYGLIGRDILVDVETVEELYNHLNSIQYI